jgi:HK97 family phage portal protein
MSIVTRAAPQNLVPPSYMSGGWFPIVNEPYTGAWQRNDGIRHETTAAYSTVYSCVTLIASDVSKVRIRLVQQDSSGIWSETTSPAFSPVLRKPNRFQNRIKFIEQWVVSKLLHGNTYILKERDGRKAVVAMYILDPTRTKPLVADDGSVYYQINRDNLAGVQEMTTVVPASEIIHDTMVPLFHPLCGVSPLTASGMAVSQGIAIQRHSAKFFHNGANPGGILTSPGNISKDQVDSIKSQWQQNYSGDNVGRVAVLGNGLTYAAMSVNAVDAQLIEQLKWTAETVCSCFHVPTYMVGVGTLPTHTNVEALNQQYYTQCLQALIESIELCLDEGLGLTDVPGQTYGTEFDIDDLLRMDTVSKVDAASKATGAGIMKIDEARRKFDLPPTEGGDACYLQEQNYSLAALAKRDAQDNPFGVKNPTAPADAPTSANDNAAARALAVTRSWERAMAGGS